MKRRLGVIIVLVIALVCSAFAGCSNKNKRRNNEKDALRMSITQPEGLFNPFFTTAATDTTVVGLTQISMFTTDENANIVFGDDWSCVTLDYSETLRDAQGKVTTTGSEDGTTTYQFVIKNGIKFSDGTPLTIKDVLFNMYIYLDPVYTGSATMYSVDILGLQAYRNLDASYDDSYQGESSIDSTAATRTANRMYNLLDWLTEKEATSQITPIKSGGTVAEAVAQAKADAESLAELFKSELETDWANATESLESYQAEYDVTKAWQVFLLTSGVTGIKTNAQNKPEKNSAGKYVIDYTSVGSNTWGDGKSGDEIVNYVYEYYSADNLVRGLASSFASVLYWSSGSTLENNIEAEERSNYIAEIKEKNEYPHEISGIKVLKGSDFEPSTASLKDTYSDDYDILQVTIKGIDPKAKWNFGFTVAPMHYYSDLSVDRNGKNAGKTDYRSFNVPGTEGYDSSKEINFGFPMGDYTYFTDVIQARNSVPMGAGPYKATDVNNRTDFNNLKTGFYDGGMIYYTRNDNFYTTIYGGEDETANAKIKLLRYKVVDSSNIMNTITTGQLDYSDGVNAKAENLSIVSNNKSLSYATAETNGYGYIGINADKIHDINLRRAIMSVLDSDLVRSYYPGNLSKVITRNLSTVSWVYKYGEPKDTAGEYYDWTPDPLYTYGDFDNSNRDLAEYTKWMEAARSSAGITQDANGNWVYPSAINGSRYLKYTFTISGASDDHPAYQTMRAAADILNENGWQITLTPDSRALTKLASGGLTVWCAAWSATVDPDMYQVYHMESKATNVNAWGYPYILQNPASEDYDILSRLSKLIDDGRKLLGDAERAPIYQEALDLLMDLAIEFPLYQRCDMYVWNTDTIDVSTIRTNPTSYMGPVDRIWEVSFK